MHALRVELNMNTALVIQAVEAACGANGEGMVEVARMVVNRASEPPPIGSPYETGHNRNSLGWVPPGGRVQGRGRSSRRGGFATDGRRYRRRDRIVVASTSGYGGWLDIGTRRIRPSHYMRRGLAFAAKNMRVPADAMRKQLAEEARRHRILLRGRRLAKGRGRSV